MGLGKDSVIILHMRVRISPVPLLAFSDIHSFSDVGRIQRQTSHYRPLPRELHYKAYTRDARQTRARERRDVL